MNLRFRSSVVMLVAWLALGGCGKKKPDFGTVKDEALTVGRTAQSFPAADEDYFKQMDGGIELSVDEVKGRNNWLVWSAGNDRFWDHLVNKSFGVVDLLKIISSHPKLPHLSRDKRWEYLGVTNEPCFEKAKAPNRDRFGLWLDTRSKDCPADPLPAPLRQARRRHTATGLRRSASP